MEREFVVYEFSRTKVERGDFSHFLERYSKDKLPTGRRLRQMMGSMIFCVRGYDNDPREIQTIPEMRRFYRSFYDAWPYWFYFCDLTQGSLKAMSACCLNELTVIKTDNQSQVGIIPNSLELLGFISHGLGKMNEMCDRGEMFESLVYNRTKALFEYFGMPALPPLAGE